MTNNIIEHKPILAKILLQDSFDTTEHCIWYEVIYFQNNTWKRSDDKCFTNGEQVVDWEYCENCLNKQLRWKFN